MRKLLYLSIPSFLKRHPGSTSADVEEKKETSLNSALTGDIYLDILPKDLEPIKPFLEGYSGIRSRDVDKHIHEIRDRLWDIYPHVSIGHFRFLSLQITSDPQYQIALDRLLHDREEATFLDVGCGVGQVIRQLAHAGVDSNRLCGVDVEPRFFDVGYDLFMDRRRLKACFVAGDLLSGSSSGKGGDERLNALDGKINIVHVTSFFHLFSWEEQVRAACRVVRFLRPDDPYVVIFGRHVGTSKTPGVPELSIKKKRDPRFLHSAETWQQLWLEVGERTGTEWRTSVDPWTVPGAEEQDLGSLQRVRFTVRRA